MYWQQPSEITEYGSNETRHVDYRAEGGRNEFDYDGRPRKHRGHHAKINLAAVEQDRARALTQERRELVEAMFRLRLYAGNAAVATALHVALT